MPDVGPKTAAFLAAHDHFMAQMRRLAAAETPTLEDVEGCAAARGHRESAMKEAVAAWSAGEEPCDESIRHRVHADLDQAKNWWEQIAATRSMAAVTEANHQETEV